MSLTHAQKKHLKKNLKKFPLRKIAADLGISEKEIQDYLKSRWQKEKYQSFLTKRLHPQGGGAPPKAGRHLGGEITQKVSLRQNWKILAFLAFLVFGVYFNSLGNDFVSDDIGSIRDNPNLGKFSYLTYFGLNLRALVIFLTHKLFGLNPLFYRLSNILFHLGSVWTVYFLIGRFFRSPVPFFTASLFAVHPILTEAVTWISGGPYSNGTFFALFSLLTYIIFANNKKWRFYFVSLASFLLALLFSEKLIIFPIILLSWEFCFGYLRKNVPKLLPFWGISGFWIFKLLGLLGARVTALESTFYQEPGIENPLIQIPIAITSYLGLLVWPKNLAFYHSEMTFSQWGYFLRLVVLLFVLGILIWSFKRHRQVFFWLSFFFISLLPTLTPLRISWIVAERYVYLGSLGIFVIFVLGMKKIMEIGRLKKTSLIIFSLILLLLSARTIVRNFDWKNQDTLWLATAKTSPSSAQNHNNLGDLYARWGDLEKAAEESKTAVKLNPRYGDAYHNLANIYHQMGKADLAIENYQKALFLNPNLWQSYQNLAAIYFLQEKFNLAYDYLQKAIILNPKNSNLYTNLGLVYLKMGAKIRAEEVFRQALQLDPKNQRAEEELILLKE